MSDAFNDAIRDRQKAEQPYASGDVRGIPVFVVKIGTHHPHSDSVIGACYWNELAAQEEVKRLNAANKHTRASYVCRWLPELITYGTD